MKKNLCEVWKNWLFINRLQGRFFNVYVFPVGATPLAISLPIISHSENNVRR